MTTFNRRTFLAQLGAASTLLPAIGNAQPAPCPPMGVSVSGVTLADKECGNASRPAGARPYDIPDFGSAAAIGLNSAASVCPFENGWGEGSWEYSLFGSYGAGAFVPQYSSAGAYVLAGTGGHGHPDYTGAVVFDFQTAAWSRLDNANGVALKDRGTSYNEVAESNGPPWFEVPNSEVPLPAHPYANLCPLPRGAQGSVVYIGRAAIGGGAKGSGAVHRFDLATRRWSRVGSDTNGRAGWVESDAVWDEVRNRYWVISQIQHYFNDLQYFDLESDTYKTTSSGGGGPDGIAGYKRTVLHDGMLLRNGGAHGLFAIDPAAGGNYWSKLTVSGDLPSTENRWVRFSDGKYYSIPNAGGNTLTRISPPSDIYKGTWVVDTVQIAGATLPPKVSSATSHYGFLTFVPTIDCLAWLPGGANKVFLLRPPV